MANDEPRARLEVVGRRVHDAPVGGGTWLSVARPRQPSCTGFSVRNEASSKRSSTSPLETTSQSSTSTAPRCKRPLPSATRESCSTRSPNLVREALHRSTALQNVLLSSAGVDRGAAEMLAITGTQRYTGQSRIVRAVVRSHHLRKGAHPKGRSRHRVRVDVTRIVPHPHGGTRLERGSLRTLARRQPADSTARRLSTDAHVPVDGRTR
jgi:hypothetical protein